MFDPVVSPFKVSMDVVMAFIKNGFESGSGSLQRQTLTWLQVPRRLVYNLDTLLSKCLVHLQFI